MYKYKYKNCTATGRELDFCTIDSFHPYLYQVSWLCDTGWTEIGKKKDLRRPVFYFLEIGLEEAYCLFDERLRQIWMTKGTHLYADRLRDR